MASAAESAQDDIKDAMALIAVASNDRTTVQKVITTFFDDKAIATFPVVAVILQDGRLSGSENRDTDNQAWIDTTLDQYADVLVLGYCAQADMEALLHDITRKALSIRETYAITANGDGFRWFITPRPLQQYRDPFPDNGGNVMVGVGFQIRITSLDPATI